MKRIGILTAGGDTPALNATILGAVERANQLRIEVFGIIKGFNGLLNPTVPHVHLNPLFQAIPELDPTRGGTILGASRTYLDARRWWIVWGGWGLKGWSVSGAMGRSMGCRRCRSRCRWCWLRRRSTTTWD